MGDESGETYSYPPEVLFSIEKNNPVSYHEAAHRINQSDAEMICIQHEYGLFGGEAGEYLFNLIKRLTKPIVTTLHTILVDPTPLQKEVLLSLAKYSEAVVAMIPNAKERLEKDYGIPEDKVVVIHHGVADRPKSVQTYKKKLGWGGKHVLLMTGLFNPNKGADYVIQALPAIVAKYPNTIFVIVGQTHPEVLKREGEKYRDSLRAKALELGVTHYLRFVDTYLPLEELLTYYDACDIYLTPHLDAQQTTSGTLAYALGLGKACISTPYTYAQEMLADERGLLVKFRDSTSIAKAVIRIFDDPTLKKELEKRSYALGRQMSWPRVAERYLILFRLIEKKYLASSQL